MKRWTPREREKRAESSAENSEFPMRDYIKGTQNVKEYEVAAGHYHVPNELCIAIMFAMNGLSLMRLTCHLVTVEDKYDRRNVGQ